MIIDLIKDIFILLPGIVLFVFSIYFSYQKIGNNILTTFSIVEDIFTEERISEITLINKKNKPITIFSIRAVINKDVVIEVEKFSPAMILKPLESAYINTTQFSCLLIGGDRYKAEYLLGNKVDLYIITEKNKIKCTVIRPPTLSSYFDFGHYKNTSKSSIKYNGNVYNDQVKYAIVYRKNNQEYTAFIGESGFIGNDWGYKNNIIDKADLESVDKVVSFLNKHGYDKLFQAFVVEDIKSR